MMMITIFFLLLFAGNINSGILPIYNSSSINETETNQPLVIYNKNNETIINGNQTSVDQNQFAETVVDLLLDLLEKANLSRTVSVIHNDTELIELVEKDDDIRTSTNKLSNL